MFFKKKIEIYIVMLSILALPISTNAMKMNEIYETEITTNEIQNQNSEEEEKQDDKDNTKIDDIKDKLNEIKKQNLKNINTYDIQKYKTHLKFYIQELLNLKKETSDEENLKTIDSLLNDINKPNNNDNLIIQNIKKRINEIKKQDFEYMNINNFVYYMNNLKICKQNLLNLKKEINNEENINAIKDILNKTNKFIIETVKSKIKIAKKQDLENINMHDIQHYNTNLKFYIQFILDLKNEISDKETINTINNISNEVDRSIITKIRLEVNKIKDQNLKNTNKNNIPSYLNNLNDYIQILLNLKKESNNKKILNTINYILEDINKLIFKESKLFMQKSEKEDFENIYTNNIQQYQQHVKTLKFYKQELLNLKKETNNEDTKNNIDIELNNIDESIIKTIKFELNKLENKYFKKNNKDKNNNLLNNINKKILNQNKIQKNIDFTISNFNQNLNIKKSKSDTDLINNFKINKENY